MRLRSAYLAFSASRILTAYHVKGPLVRRSYFRETRMWNILEQALDGKDDVTQTSVNSSEHSSDSNIGNNLKYSIHANEINVISKLF